jgi:glycine betaine/choline ABC-type transport system substrate-binding protein
VLLAEGPAFAATIDEVDSLLSITAIRELNAEVDLYGQDPAAVAKRFLQAHRILPPS